MEYFSRNIQDVGNLFDRIEEGWVMVVRLIEFLCEEVFCENDGL